MTLAGNKVKHFDFQANFTKQAVTCTALNAAISIGTLFASAALNKFFTNAAYSGSIEEAQDTPADNRPETEESAATPTKTKEELAEEVRTILKDNNIQIDESSLDDLVKKYTAMQTVNPDITDAEVSRRITNYAKALVRHDQKRKIVKANPNDDATLELKIIDTDMTPEVMTDQNKYIQALYNRGEGELSIYDLNGDNEVTEDEYIAVETGSTKMELLQTDVGKADLISMSNSFCKIDFNSDGKLTADEFGAAEYASYRLYDYLNEDGEFVETEVKKTGNELSYDEIIGSTAILTGANNDKDDPERKEFSRLQKGAYNLLKNYKPQ